MSLRADPAPMGDGNQAPVRNNLHTLLKAYFKFCVTNSLTF